VTAPRIILRPDASPAERRAAVALASEAADGDDEERDAAAIVAELAERAPSMTAAELTVERAAAHDRIAELLPDRGEREIERMLAAVPEPWPEPIPLSASRDLPPFPLDALPDWLREWVTAEAHATQTPPDMAAMLALAVLATSCARKLRVHVRDGWSEPPCIYTAIVLPPANRKSAVMRDARAPLDAYEREQAEQHASEIASTRDALDVAQKRHARALDRAAKTEGAERTAAEQDAYDARNELSAAERAIVRAPRLTCGDTTQEALARLLVEQGECMGLFDAEGCGPLAIMLGRYSDGSAAIDLYLRAHAGDTYRADRVGRDPIVLNRPALTMALAIQPDVLRQLGERREVRGLGLLARVLWAVPVSTVGRRSAEPAPMPERVRAAYAGHVRALLNLAAASDGEPHTVRMGAAAWAELRALTEWIEARLGAGGDLEHVADWAGKLAGACARIAGALHAAEHPRAPWDAEVSADTMRRAIAIGEYLLAHARAALSSMGADPTLADAEHVLEWLRAREVRQVTRRDLWHAHRGTFQRSEMIEPALAVLAERGWIRMREAPARGGPGRRPSPTIEVHPRAWSAGHIDRYDHNAPARCDSGHSGQSGHGSEVQGAPAGPAIGTPRPSDAEQGSEVAL
jgi:replicative DNA helicase